MKKLFKDLAIVLLLTMVILIGVIILPLVLRSNSDLSESVSIKVGEGVLTLPPGYVYGVMSSQDGALVEIRVLLPDLEPKTPKNREHFEGYKPEIATIYLNYHFSGNGTGKDFYKNLMKSKSLTEYSSEDTTPVPTIDGYKIMRFRTVNLTEYITKTDELPYMISCDDQEHQRADLKAKNPSCIAEVPIKDLENLYGPEGQKYTIILNINRSNLNQIPEITKKAIKFIREHFEVNINRSLK